MSEVVKPVDLKELEQGITSSTAQKTETSHKPEDSLKSSEEPSESWTTESPQMKTKPSGNNQDILTSSLNRGDDGKAEDKKTKPMDIIEAKDQLWPKTR